MTGVIRRAGETFDDTYTLYLAEGVFFDMMDDSRWINHSCAPNASVRARLCDDGAGEAHFVALRDIAAGEELTYDYAFPKHQALPCNCGSTKCRGLIIDTDELTDPGAPLQAPRVVEADGDA